MAECCLFLRGEFFIKDAIDDCPICPDKIVGANYKKIGNTSLCEVSINSILNGVENKFNRVSAESRLSITSVSMSMTLECVSKENLLLAFGSEERESISDYKEERICYDGDSFIILSYNPLGDIILTGKDSFGNDIQIFEIGIDYTIDGSKIKLLNVINGVENIYASYYFDAVGLFSFSLGRLVPKYKDIYFRGENVTSNEQVEIRFFRVLLNPLSSFDIVSKDQLFNLPLTGIVEESNKGYFKFDIIGGNDELGEIIY